ncbi:MAG TPA: hypothetical protein VF198_18180 [Vicinamibacterales bacterium]
MRRLQALSLALALAPVLLVGPAAAQDSRSEAPTRELVSLLDKQKLDAIAARIGEEEFAAALYIPGVQLLVVSAKYTAPALLNEKIINRNYRDVYLDLSAASVPESKLFIEDMRADGLHPRRKGDDPFDIVTRGTNAPFLLDGETKAKKISEAQYERTFAEADAEYERIIQALLTEIRKTS